MNSWYHTLAKCSHTHMPHISSLGHFQKVTSLSHPLQPKQGCIKEMILTRDMYLLAECAKHVLEGWGSGLTPISPWA
jgi:hypothetical protein